MTFGEERFVPDAAFLSGLEAAGESVEMLKRVWPRRVWPPEWTIDAEPEPQEPTSAPRADDRDQPVEDIDDMDIPF
jgi:hypothetical protein